jgi:hypothetical protein
VNFNVFYFYFSPLLSRLLSCRQHFGQWWLLEPGVGSIRERSRTHQRRLPSQPVPTWPECWCRCPPPVHDCPIGCGHGRTPSCNGCFIDQVAASPLPRLSLEFKYGRKRRKELSAVIRVTLLIKNRMLWILRSWASPAAASVRPDIHQSELLAVGSWRRRGRKERLLLATLEIWSNSGTRLRHAGKCSGSFRCEGNA